MNFARQMTLSGSLAVALMATALAGCLPMDDDHGHHHHGDGWNVSTVCYSSSECGLGQFCDQNGLCITIVGTGGGSVDGGARDLGKGTGGATGTGASGMAGARGTGGARVSGGTGAVAGTGGRPGTSGSGGAVGAGGASPIGGVKVACVTNVDCPATDCCVSGACQANPLPTTPSDVTPVCQFNSDCAGGARCHNATCERPCASDLACGSGDVCRAGFCQPDPVGGTACVLNSECAGASDGVSPIGGTQTLCINGHCHNGCRADSDCGALDRCVSGLCTADTRPKASCRVNTDCPATESCVGGTCRFACAVDTDCCACGPATLCRSGFCITPGEAAPMCALAKDCGVSASCVDATCQ